MAFLADVKKFITAEEVNRNAGVNQSTWRKIGGMINFIGNRVHEVKRFTVNGSYGQLGGGAYPFTFVDGAHVFEFDAEIFNIWVYQKTQGTSGQTELDLKVAPYGSNTWSSIFTTTPKILPAAADGVRFKIGDVQTGVVAPVMTGATVNVNAGDAIRMDLISAMANPNQAGLIIHFRPR
jgi:hypothetical protein